LLRKAFLVTKRVRVISELQGQKEDRYDGDRHPRLNSIDDRVRLGNQSLSRITNSVLLDEYNASVAQKVTVLSAKKFLHLFSSTYKSNQRRQNRHIF
jgi:hypothetical protein